MKNIGDVFFSEQFLTHYIYIHLNEYERSEASEKSQKHILMQPGESVPVNIKTIEWQKKFQI